MGPVAVSCTAVSAGEDGVEIGALAAPVPGNVEIELVAADDDEEEEPATALDEEEARRCQKPSIAGWIRGFLGLGDGGGEGKERVAAMRVGCAT